MERTCRRRPPAAPRHVQQPVAEARIGLHHPLQVGGRGVGVVDLLEHLQAGQPAGGQGLGHHRDRLRQQAALEQLEADLAGGAQPGQGVDVEGHQRPARPAGPLHPSGQLLLGPAPGVEAQVGGHVQQRPADGGGPRVGNGQQPPGGHQTPVPVDHFRIGPRGGVDLDDGLLGQLGQLLGPDEERPGRLDEGQLGAEHVGQVAVLAGPLGHLLGHGRRRATPDDQLVAVHGQLRVEYRTAAHDHPGPRDAEGIPGRRAGSPGRRLLGTRNTHGAGHLR